LEEIDGGRRILGRNGVKNRNGFGEIGEEWTILGVKAKKEVRLTSLSLFLQS